MSKKIELAKKVVGHSGVSAFHVKKSLDQVFNFVISAVSDETVQEISLVKDTLISECVENVMNGSAEIVASEMSETELKHVLDLLNDPVLSRFLLISYSREEDYAKIGSDSVDNVVSSLLVLIKKISVEDYDLVNSIFNGSNSNDVQSKQVQYLN